MSLSLGVNTTVHDDNLPSRIADADRPRPDGLRHVRIWLWVLIGLVLGMVMVGGATRLTDSGLSITEWRPLTGAIPPLNEAAWLSEFEKYRASSQYALINRGMALADFKVIYWWEWGHRQFGRLIGLAFFLPLAWFAVRGTLRGRWLIGLAALGALGGLQAAVGWIMVASGLTPGMAAVAPVKLTLHLTIACVIVAGLVLVVTRLRPVDEPPPAQGQSVALVLPFLVLAQIALGGLVAGLDAGLVYNTWPLIDGRWIPTGTAYWFEVPAILNLVANHLAVQFNHRLGAYLLLAVVLWHALVLVRAAPQSAAARRAMALAAVTLTQAALGIVTLLLQVPLWAGLAHQLLGVGLLALAVRHAALYYGTDLRAAHWQGGFGRL